MKKFFFISIFVLLAISSYIFFRLTTHNETLNLPTQLEVVQATPASQLGMREDNLGVNIGSQIADFKMNTYDNHPIMLHQLLQEKMNFVIFYRGGWCPYCNYHIRQLAQAYPEFAKNHIQLILISADAPEASQLVQTTYHIPFPVLSDPLLVAHQTFNVTLQLEKFKVLIAKIFFDVEFEKWSKQPHHKIAVPAFFLLDQTGTVKWEHIARDYTTRPSPEQLLTVANHLKSRNLE